MYGYTTFHDELIKKLIKSVHNGTSSHAYIFEGEKGLFKHEAAQLFAATLTCQNTSVSPCGTCPACIQAKSKTNPDIIYIEKSNDKKTIGVEPIRTLNDDVAIRPFYSQKKVYIINEGDILTPEAQNAFLKTLEEPPEYAVFIIIVENSSALLQTVLSRASLIHFTPVSDKLIEQYINEKYPEHTSQIEFLTRYCEGIPGVADDVIADESFEALRTESINKLPVLLSKNKLSAYAIQKFIDENKDNAEKIFDFWISYLRDVTVIQCSAPDRIINIDKNDKLRILAEKYEPTQIVNAVKEILNSKKMLKRYVNLKALSLMTALKI
ncbi:MAG: DNA polymerase III subunit [Clostridia bacterium]|nr:DNA polymerase III subunit [Clostridia bacterium]